MIETQIETKVPKKVLVALPKGMLLEIDAVAATEHRSRSDLIRESLRRYLDVFKRNRASLKQTELDTSVMPAV